VSLELREVPHLYSSWKTRWQDRDARMDTMAKVVRGDFGVLNEYDGQKVESRSPNVVQVALEDTAEAASIMPTIRVRPCKAGPTAKEKAQRMERIGMGYMDVNSMELLIPRLVMDMAAYGLGAVTVTPDFEQRLPLIERRDPRHCYPEPGWRPGDTVRRVLFTRYLYYSQLPEDYKAKIKAAYENAAPEWQGTIRSPDANTQVILVEYYDENEIVVAALYQGSLDHYPTGGRTEVPYMPVELDRIIHNLGACPVVVDGRITLDGEPRGQFDQVVGLLEAHIQLMGTAIDYADQAVYSDVWVRDLIGTMPFGGGAYIELGPQGAIGRVPPAVSSLDLQRDLEHLIDGIHLGGRWPKSRPGEIDQAIASAKFVEATAGIMNTAIRTYHLILQRALGRMVRLAFQTDVHFFSGMEKRVTGVLRNQQFIEDYDPAKDIDLENVVRVEYGLGLGRDPAQSAVLHIQYGQNEFISKEFVQEHIDGLSDVAREQARIDTEKFKGMALAKLLQGLEAGTVPESALVEIARAREKGEDLFDLYEKYIAKPKEEQQAQMVDTGLGQMMPGMGPEGMAPGGPPGAPGAPAGPPSITPPEGSDLLARINVPAGEGGVLGAQVMG